MSDESVRALQRALVEAALVPDPGPLAKDPGGFAAGLGLPAADQEAFRRFRDRLLLYRHLVRLDLLEPVEEVCRVTRALLAQEGAWAACADAFLQARAVPSIFYQEVAAAFVAWLADAHWGAERWPCLLPLAHSEWLAARVAQQPLAPVPAGLHAVPRLGDALVLDPPAQVTTYPYRVHLATPEQPVPEPGTVHLLAYRDREGGPHWLELTPAAAALLVEGQRKPIGQVLLELGVEDLSEAVDLLSDLRDRGAILGFGG